MENRCNDDMEIFYSLTRVTIGDGSIASFWNDPWADGIIPKCIAPSIFTLSKRKTGNVQKFTTDNAWVLHLDTLGGLSLQHLQEFTNLWAYTAMMSWTALLGSLPPMGSTLVLRLTRRNSLG
jgi:hypothetical protein